MTRLTDFIRGQSSQEAVSSDANNSVERVATGKGRSIKEWLDYGGKDHLHQRLERALGSRQASVAMISLMTIYLGLAA